MYWAFWIGFKARIFKKDLRKKGCKNAFIAPNIEIEVAGIEHEKTQLFLINHQSFVDIFLLEAVSKHNLSWIAKRELLKVPVLGYMLEYFKMIVVDRENKAGLVKLIKDVKDRVQDNRVVCIFPEGTRIKEQPLGKFKGGAKLLVNKLKLQVQPVVIVGAHQMLNTKTKQYTKTKIKVIYLPPVDCMQNDWYEKTKEQMQEVIDYEYKHNNRSR